MILLADDNDILRRLITRQLAELGHLGHAVSNGREAVEHALRNNYNLILMDIQMPELDGFEAFKQIRAAQKTSKLPPTPVVAITGVEDRDTCLKAGLDGYEAKPISQDRLKSLVNQWVTTGEFERLEQIAPSLGQILKETRQEKKLTLNDLSLATGIQVKELAAIENGEDQFPILHLIKIGLALAVPASELIGMTEKKLNID